MSSRSALEKAEMFDLTRKQVTILYHITAWFNGHPREVRGNEVSIASALEPTLPQLCGYEWTRGFDDHHQQLVQRGLLKEDTGNGTIYVGGNRCEWLPTRDGMKVIEELFKHRDDIYPPWVTDQHSRPPTFRDGEELLEHRKGTMAARFTFTQVNPCRRSIETELATTPPPSLRPQICRGEISLAAGMRARGVEFNSTPWDGWL